MENKINIAELLKDCPSGVELDSPLFDNLYFDCIDAGKKYCVKCYIRKGVKTSVIFNCYGQFTDDSKCMIFPKGKTAWEGFVPPCKFKDGDILYVDCTEEYDDKQHDYIFIFNEIYNDQVYSYCHYYRLFDYFGFSESEVECLTDDKYPIRLATEEEKQKLFDVIKDRGYRWNAETKTLEKLIVLKFKVGDTIQNKETETRRTITKIHQDCYECDNRYVLIFENQDEWELVPNKFDITTLKPFDKVLMRSSNAREWDATLYSHYNNNKFYGCGMCCDQCIPYEQNKHLLGTTNDCDEFFRNWE